ncbi:ectoine/hydroxyectoine ABC transporter permease subunit EhuC [Labrys wisconsinensis]|uniref:Polar amino acid transport system permease protein n=1 Tax=Labrys wisconsinensis TaxID=425677 RepID=A0ABU0JF38_9HYPH|nr:ectoine/hydroxyectoine ABC transporter permease subunit EhuC [Labrys wisconsinensis]MDQ0472111.1 polar amino acid transport system permease protein [Labrys wisconsinensis]
MEDMLGYLRYLAVGMKATATVGSISFISAVLIALVVGIVRAQQIPVLKSVAFVYVEIFRGTSLLVQLFWLYYTLPLFGITVAPLTAACLGLALNSGAYGSEIVRGALLAVPKDQLEAATALNLNAAQTLWKITLPQAAVEMVPPFGNLAILVLKDTALVSMISIADVAFKAQELRTFTYDSARIYTVTLLVYFGMALIVMAIGRIAEHYLRPPYLRRRTILLGRA